MLRDIIFIVCILIATIIFAFRVDDIKDDIKFEKKYPSNNINELLANFDTNKKWLIFCLTMLISQTLLILIQIPC